MCYRTKLNAKIEKIERAFNAGFSEPEQYQPLAEINAFDFSATPVISDVSPQEILFYNWGLIPHWAKDDNIKKSTLNARIETAPEKPAFRDAVQNRCLILANGFFEWQWLDNRGRRKQKYLIRAAKEEILAFAGFYSIWRNPLTGDIVPTYSIATTAANELMSEIHNNKQRMPVVLLADDRQSWLQGAAIEDFAFPYEAPLVATKVH